VSFAKLDSGIVNSTIWVQPHDVLRVWVWFLSQANARGVVRTAAPSLAHACMVPLDRLRDILTMLESPDEDSRTPDHEGRRIEKIAGGWQILNYAQYRKESRDPEDRREQNREAQQRYRDRISQSKPEISQCNPNSAEAEAEEERAKETTLRVVGDLSITEPAAATDAAVDEATDAASSAIPVARIVDLYHEHLPELPRVEKLTRNRRGYIQQRWREDLHSLDEWRNFFTFVGESPFLMGRKPGSNGRPPFLASLDWLTRPENYAKIAEEKFHRG